MANKPSEMSEEVHPGLSTPVTVHPEVAVPRPLMLSVSSVLRVCVMLAMCALYGVLYQQAWYWVYGPCVWATANQATGSPWYLMLSQVLVPTETQQVCAAQRSFGENQMTWIRYQCMGWSATVVSAYGGSILSWFSSVKNE